MLKVCSIANMCTWLLSCWWLSLLPPCSCTQGGWCTSAALHSSDAHCLTIAPDVADQHCITTRLMWSQRVVPGSSKCLLDSFRLPLLVLPMQMHKVATYAQAKLLEQHIGVALRPVYIKRPTGSAAGTAPPPEQLLPPTHVDPATGNLIPWQGNVQELELTCNGLVSWPVNVQ